MFFTVAAALFVCQRGKKEIVPFCRDRYCELFYGTIRPIERYLLTACIRRCLKRRYIIINERAIFCVYATKYLFQEMESFVFHLLKNMISDLAYQSYQCPYTYKDIGHEAMNLWHKFFLLCYQNGSIRVSNAKIKFILEYILDSHISKETSYAHRAEGFYKIIWCTRKMLFYYNFMLSIDCFPSL